jgi:hypothetical protein
MLAVQNLLCFSCVKITYFDLRTPSSGCLFSRRRKLEHVMCIWGGGDVKCIWGYVSLSWCSCSVKRGCRRNYKCQLGLHDLWTSSVAWWKQCCVSENESAFILGCKYVAVPAGLDRYKEWFSVLIRRIRITSISVYITEEIKWNRKRSVVGAGEWSGRPGRRNPGNYWAKKKSEKWLCFVKFVICIMNDQFVLSFRAPEKNLATSLQTHTYTVKRTFE